VLCAGALLSPTILMNSGVGDHSLLQRNNINTVHDLPGVGKNFHDHTIATVARTLKTQFTGKYNM